MAVPCTHVESHGFFARHLQGGKSLRTDVEGDCERSNLISWLEILFGTLEDMRRRYFFFILFFFFVSAAFQLVTLSVCALTSHLTR